MKVLVTGGGGFLGSAIVQQLLARGDEVRILARGAYPRLQALGAETFQGDIRQKADVARACEDRELVFHVAAKAGVWGDPAEFEAINLTGTQHVLQSCLEAGVPHLVYTSSPSVVQGTHGHEGADEGTPYPDRHLADYPRTKALAEQQVVAASGSALLTVSLRPHLIWGPGDPHLLPRLEARARAGKLRRIGNGDPLIDAVYIENAAWAHLLAADALRAGKPLGGKVYFITNGEPVGCWTLVNQLLKAVGAPPVTRQIPAWLAVGMGSLLESSHRLLGREGEPMMTRFVALELSSPHWFNIDAARRDLGYAPKVSMAEGLKRLRAWHEAGRPTVL